MNRSWLLRCAATLGAFLALALLLHDSSGSGHFVSPAEAQAVAQPAANPLGASPYAPPVNCNLTSGVVSFFGADYEGDSLVWCIDSSSSMGVGGRLDQVKLELVAALPQLGTAQTFNLVRFGDSITTFRPGLVSPTASTVAAAVQWVQQLQPDGFSSLAAGGYTAVRQAEMSPEYDRNVILVSDALLFGSAWPGAISGITSTNAQLIPIHTVFLESSPTAATFMQQLAAENGGSFTYVP